ncbi:hypothetical protein Ddye_012313 [Dipteronia dyeriana]|uniref:MULE transposase domain-containing protein n=1 Tax=Dipteronia dyeriana TaxID=168575 RepID=A0AAD9X469_9ROSI|nr:hypothetical protein Ddye_012313 [Dipteronia dyeriana]
MGFIEGCRPFIGIDGCHLKGPYGGVILSTIALDANSGLYPLAYCICEGETLLSWSCFLQQLCCFLKYPEDRPIFFMSDRQKGVIGALKMYRPNASLRFYARHIYVNFSTKYSGQKMKKLFWKASKIGEKHEFKKCLQDIVNEKIKDNSVECRILRTLHSCQGKYKMLGLNKAYTANLNDKTCSVANDRSIYSTTTTEEKTMTKTVEEEGIN